jgi:hypothetical protein
MPLDPSVFAEPVMSQREAETPAIIPELAWPIGGDGPKCPWLRPERLPRGIPRILGLRIAVKLLGHGPRGQTLLARPLSLDDPDVLKLLPADRAADRVFMAQFTREALAASQLTHPNLVAIRELGCDRGHHFAAVERVAGPSLAEFLKEDGFPLEPFHASVLILQAARGLRAAHEQGLWHRDVKPENLRLDPAGLVKVDDLGLEMTPSLAAAITASEDPKPTPVQAAAGSPQFMAPEQASNPVSSDGRADVYALGGTFYNLVTCRLPFEAENAVELLRKHREEALVPPREFAPKVPRAISDVIQTMMGKRLDERYPSMAVVVDVLEGVLGLRSEKATLGLEEAGEAIGRAAAALGTLPARRLRFKTLDLSVAIWLGFVVLLLWLRLWWPATGILVFGVVTALALVVSSGITHRSELLRLASRWILGGGPGPWMVLIAAAAITLMVLLVWGGSLPWFLLICAGGLVAAFHFFIDRPLAMERRSIVKEARESLRNLRARGHAEETLRALFASHGGKHWEELFEAVFGHRVLVRTWSRGFPRKRRGLLGRCRDVVFAFLEKRLEARRDLRATRLVESTEEGRLEDEGVNLLTARRRARRIAKAMVFTAAQWRDEQRLLASDQESHETCGPPLLERLCKAASQPEPTLEPHEQRRRPLLLRAHSLSSVLLGRGTRFLLGSGLLILFAAWLDASGIITVAQVRDQARQIDQVTRRAIQSADPAVLRELRWGISWDWQRLEEPVAVFSFPVSPRTAIEGANLGAATLFLLLSLLSGRRITGFLAILASGLSLFGPLWGVVIPAFTERLDASAQARYLGALILIAGLLWPRRKST